MKYIIGIDVGTTAVKAVAYDLKLKKIKEVSQTYPLIKNMPGQAEEDPKVIFDAVQNISYALNSAINGELLAISWSSQMHSLIGLDQEDNLLTNSITWADNRAEEVVNHAKKTGLAYEIYQKTGMPVHPMAPIYKLMWLREADPAVYSKVTKWMGIKEYLIYRLTGKFVQDIPLAAGTGMLNLKTKSWDRDLIQKVGLYEEQLPKLVTPKTIIDDFNEEYQKKLNCSSDTVTVVGSSDGYLSTIGVGVLNDHDMAINVGTSGAVRTIAKELLIDKKARNFCYPIDQVSYLVGAPVNNGGIIFDWAKNMIVGSDITPQEMIDLANNSEPGSGGLIFHPYLCGERAPIWNAMAKGSFTGLTYNQTKAQMTRSVIEGILMNLYEAAEGMLKQFDHVSKLKVTGGFMQSDFVKKMTANIFNLPVVSVNNSQSGSFAAMFLARLALGFSQEFSELDEMIKEDKIYYPNKKEVTIYKDLFPIYLEVGKELEKSYRKLNEFQLKYPSV